IEEAILMADRVLVLSSNPGRIRTEIPVTLTRPRDRDDPEFKRLVDSIYTIMTTPATQATVMDEEETQIATRLPRTPIERVAGLLERVATGPDYGHDDLPILAAAMHLDVDDLFPITDAAVLLGFASVVDGDITLLPFGAKFVDGDIQERKALVAARLVTHVPLIAHIVRVLRLNPDGRVSEDRFLRELEDFVGADDAQAIFDTAIEWGRYAELIEFDVNGSMVKLDSGAMHA
ncbi:MAG: AAA-associated domain-containing protein, partial [Thermomicrobiales bacterium]